MNPFNLKDKVAIITGGNRGIGKSIAMSFGEAGAQVVISARNVNLLARTAREINGKGGSASYVECDLTNNESIYNLIKETVDRYGKIDILVNNGAISPFVKKSEEVTMEMWKDIIQVNLLAPFLLCREAGKIMMQHNWGRIINVTSAGGIIGLPRQIAYCATKGALIQVTKVLAIEWSEKYNITVNAIAPGWVATDLTSGIQASEKISSNLLQRIPSRRFGEADEIAGAALYLASESSSYTTGSVLAIDGGMLSC
jgi:NAD(P)-dependent dehydrogenase (short-subunit alcohol dehydrogenase family)